MPIPAGVPAHVDVPASAASTPHATQSASATGHNRVQRFALMCGHACATPLQVRIPEVAHNLCE